MSEAELDLGHELVYQADVEGVYVPYRSLKPVHGVFLRWCAEQEIPEDQQKHVKSVEVYRESGGQLVAHFARHDLYTPEEHAQKVAEAKAKGGTGSVSRVKVYGARKADGKPDIRTHVEHHLVSSIKLLLDDLDAPAGLSLSEPGVNA